MIYPIPIFELYHKTVQQVSIVMKTGGSMKREKQVGQMKTADSTTFNGVAVYGPIKPPSTEDTLPERILDKLADNKEDKTDNPWEKQIGGNHYKGYAIEPFEFFYVNNIPHHKATIIRRILRYDHPTGGGIKDLKKIKHEVDLIISLYEKEQQTK